MAACGVCGKNSIFPETFGTLTLCKKCSIKILSPIWKNKVFTTNDEIKAERDSVVRMARNSAFPESAINALAHYFNDQILDGLIQLFDGGVGQVLAVFDDHFVIDTQEEFDYEEIEGEYRAMMTPSLRGKGAYDPEEESRIDGQMISSAVQSAISGLVSGGSIGRGVMRAGAGIASEIAYKSKIKDAVSKEIANIELKVTFGLRELSYSDFEDAVLRLPVGEEDYGFIRFQKGPEPNPSKDYLFFFDGDDGKKEIKKLHAIMQEKIIIFAEEKAQQEREEKIKAREEKASQDDPLIQAAIASVQQPQFSAPDELMKWKQLLDAGAITQDEYEAKKKLLLGL